MKNNQLCQKEELASTLAGNITLCECGIYHIHLNAVTLHLTCTQFIAASRLFKIAFGMFAGHRLFKGSFQGKNSVEWITR